MGSDVEDVRRGVGLDRRIGSAFLFPGVGYGGSCFPKDVQALERTAHANGYQARLLGAVEAVNRDQKRRLFELLTRHFGGVLSGTTIALWGLAFKPNTDDMREAPSRVLMEALWRAGARVRAYDPQAGDETARIYGQRDDLVLCDDPWAALEGADALAVVTEWKVFRSPDFARIKSMLKNPVIFDGRNLYDPPMVESAGLAYYGIGRGRSTVAAKEGMNDDDGHTERRADERARAEADFS
jgi:UDPglucose 6-dehydrogenase